VTGRPGSGRAALVTGASAGIGTELARVFAANGFDLVLTARRAERLQQLAQELENEHSIRARVIVADLADPQAPARLFAATREDGRHIDVLVNNAGYGVPGYFLTQSWPTHRDFIQVMMTAVAHLTHLYLPAMVESGYGRILNLASLAGLTPGAPGSTLYGAAKSFVIQLSQTLHMENRERGVHVCALCPGFTLSEFHDVTGARAKVSRLPGYLWMNADEVARQGYAAVMAGKPVHISGGVNRTIAALFKTLPHRTAHMLIRRQSRRFRVARPDTATET